MALPVPGSPSAPSHSEPPSGASALRLSVWRAVSTVTCARKRYKLKFSKLHNREFGPYGFVEAIGQLRFAANLEPLAARDLVMDAAVAEDRTATAPVG